MERNLLAKFQKNERNTYFSLKSKPMEFVVESSLNTHELLKTCPDPYNKGLIHFIYFGSLKLLAIELFLLYEKN